MEREKVIATCKRHWTAYLGRGLIAALFIYYAPGYMAEGDISGGIICLVFAAIFITWIIFEYRNEYVMITPTKVVGHVGLIRSKGFRPRFQKFKTLGIPMACSGKFSGITLW